MDDIKLYTKIEQDIDSLIYIPRIYSTDIDSLIIWAKRVQLDDIRGREDGLNWRSLISRR